MRPENNPVQKYLTREECQELIRVSPATMYRRLRSGEIEHYKIGGKYLIPLNSVKDYLEKNRD